MKKLITLIKQWRERRLRYKIVFKILNHSKVDELEFIPGLTKLLVDYINTGKLPNFS